MPHKGRLYPFAEGYWAVPAFFWPGYIPRKIVATCSAGYGIYWDFFVGGRVSQTCHDPTGFPWVGEWDFTVPDPEAVCTFIATFLPPFILPPGGDFTCARIGFPTHTSLHGHWTFPKFVFNTPTWDSYHADDGYGGPVPPNLTIRPATWSEV